MVFKRGDENASMEKYATLAVGGIIGLMFFALLPNIIQYATGVNINMKPMNYADPATLNTSNPQVINCEQVNTAVDPDYNPTNQQQYDECKAVQISGLKNGGNIAGFWGAFRIAMVAVTAVIMSAGILLMKLRPDTLTA